MISSKSEPRTPISEVDTGTALVVHWYCSGPADVILRLYSTRTSLVLHPCYLYCIGGVLGVYGSCTGSLVMHWKSGSALELHYSDMALYWCYTGTALVQHWLCTGRVLVLYGHYTGTALELRSVLVMYLSCNGTALALHW